ncbi:MAG: alpha/beta hydrolase, partial [Acidimicrobiales bacterium]
ADAPPPVLVLANTGDPITPPAGAERAAALLPNAALLRYSTGGHVRHTRNPCALDIVNAFLTNRQLPAPDTAC